MKKGYVECPFCANEIKEGAKKCQYCKEFLIKNEKEVLFDENSKKREKRDFAGSEVILTMSENQLQKCIKIGNARINRWSRILALRIPCSFFVVFLLVLLSYLSFWLSVFIIFFLSILPWMSIIFYFIWLIRNYKILIDSNIKGLNHKTYFNLIFCWICPILHLFRPQNSLSDLLNNISNNFGENFDKNIVNEWQRYFDVTLISFFLIDIFYSIFAKFEYSLLNVFGIVLSVFSIISLILFIVFNIIQVRTLAKIVGKIVHSEEICLKMMYSK